MILPIDIHRWFAKVAILNPKWPPKYKNPPIWTKFGFQVDYDVANWYPGVFWSEELAGALNSDMGVVWGLLCLHPNTIKPSYYYYSSCCSPNELVQANSQRLVIRSLLIFTGTWFLISRGALRSWNFQNGRRCHGNREHISKYLTSLISETA